ncbi:fatty-acyl-CoA synthase [Mycobacterium saskatchewanense]|uniref:Long-chain fatty acid--CoA ligase n=1 Tax=Mycobacterium saskatchewanense TaxID=220927 RepID=A0AAJ3TW49_9MYCO|nr:class I adenylate-forming enzyme family protein [Mycobacterium saskatchewanense]ORW73125.1 long-chain fatty acid--CoA ligase [Mycobacterium saskatchewanense]BBX62397.1 fatty-acyl-CoA synthase [Mycobacterium saskatchewanense]
MTTSPAGCATRQLAEAFWAADRSVPLVDDTVGGLLAARAAEHPGRKALVAASHDGGDSVQLSYAELFEEARRVAGALAALADPGDFVALWAPNVVEWTLIQYGAALAGVVLVALNPLLRESELDYALRHCRASVLLHADVSRDYRMVDVAERVCRDIAGLRRVSLSDTAAWKSTGVDPHIFSRAPVDPDTPVMLQYTSGTTGLPKGVLLTHRALVNVAKLTMEATRVPKAAVCMNPLPLFHTAGCVIATLGPLWVGGTAVVCGRFTPGSALSALRAHGATVLFYVPTLLRALLEHQRASNEPAPALRIIMGGAADVSAELIDGAAAVFGANVYNLYGQTELAPVLTLTRPSDSHADRLCTVGRPLPQVDCKVIDPCEGHVVPVGQTGEICARGYQQFVEYLHDPEGTARALDADGFLRTGDLGTMDDRGFITVTGRLKELIIRGGENLSPAEIERVVTQFDCVEESVAVGLPDDRLGEIVCVVCRGAGLRRSALKDDLIAHCRARMAAYKVPVRWFLADQFPVTATGKVRRFALREAILRNELDEL